MMTIAKFPLPDVGEGLTEAEIVSWKVAPGDQVSVNQTICEIETAKSIVELPCPFAGEVTELLFAEGDTVEVGNPIIAVRVAGASPIPALSEPDAPAGPVVIEPDTGAEYKLPTLVGYGDAGDAKSRRKRAIASVAPVTTAIPVSMVRAIASSIFKLCIFV
jgi:pyruvate dehydrogenase E2 component (dihydrolipoamide acetyltransferase)